MFKNPVGWWLQLGLVVCTTMCYPNLPNMLRMIISRFGNSSQPTNKNIPNDRALGLPGYCECSSSAAVGAECEIGQALPTAFLRWLLKMEIDIDRWIKLATLVDEI